MSLTKIECDWAACPADRPSLRLADEKGMYLEVTAAGGKYWRMKYRHAGKEKRLALGVYPAVSLAQARKARDQAREALAQGDDPAQLKREAKLTKTLGDASTFEKVARQWWEHWKGPKTARHSEYVLRRLEADVFPALGARPVASITAPQLLAMAKGIEARGALDIAKRSLQTCGQIMRYAVAHGLIERNPAADVRPADALKPQRKTNYARLDAREMPELLRKIEAYQGSAFTRLAMKLLVSFQAQRQEVNIHAGSQPFLCSSYPKIAVLMAVCPNNTYDRAEFLEQRRKMMLEWADYLDKLRTGAEVIPFRVA